MDYEEHYKISLKHNRDNFKIDLSKAEEYSIYLEKLYKNKIEKMKLLENSLVNNDITINILKDIIKNIDNDINDL